MTADPTLLTGATGLLGRYLLRDLAGRGVPLAVLVRGTAGRPAGDRLAAVLGDWSDDRGRPLPRPHLLEGDLTAPGLGLSGDDRRWLARNCRQVVHNAASLRFTGTDRAGEPWQTNVGGTANLLGVCGDAGVRAVHHVSTAYVCGQREDLVGEDNPLPAAGFRNDYEASKAEAERLVRAARFPQPQTVYRPAIIVGDSRTGFTSTYHGLYLYLQFIDLLARRAAVGVDGRWRLPLRLDLTGAERRNLVPVDWVSGCLADLVSRPECHGRTYHLTPDRPATAGELEAGFAAAFGYTGVSFVGSMPFDRTELEAAFYRQMSTYAPYWRAEPQFDKRHTRAALPDRLCPPVDAALVDRLIAFAVRDGWGRKKAPAPAVAA